MTITLKSGKMIKIEKQNDMFWIHNRKDRQEYLLDILDIVDVKPAIAGTYIPEKVGWTELAYYLANYIMVGQIKKIELDKDEVYEEIPYLEDVIF